MTTPTKDLGTVTVEGGFALLEFHRRLPHPPETVWRALTDPSERSLWYIPTRRLEPRVGGRVEMVAGPLELQITGRVLQWDPPRVLEHEWKVLPRREHPQGEDAVVKWELRPDGDGTLLHLTHRHVRVRTAAGVAPGIHAFLDRIASHLSGAPLPDAQSQYRELLALYRATPTAR